MLIAQISDFHLGFEPDNPDEPNRGRLDQVVAKLRDGPNRPDLVIASGDLVDRGDLDSYRRVRDALAELAMPVHFALGNHDDRANFAAVFPDVPTADGFVQYCVTQDGLRIVVLDTLEEGRHGGGFCAVRAAWLAARLAEAPETPTVIVMHHPPVVSGIDWMDPAPHEDWIGRFAAAVAGHRQVLAIWCGHLHRPIAMNWHGKTLSICPSVSPELSLDLRAIDAAVPDQRPVIADGPPGLACHRWHAGQLVTFFDSVAEHAVLAKYDDGFQKLIAELFAERALPTSVTAS